MNRFWTTTLAVVLASCAHAAVASGPVAMTEAGVVKGEETDAYRRFRAIPYAAPPVGELRWRAPRPAPAWSGVRDATQPGPACLQGAGGTGASRLTEDCLYLDVVAPRGADRRRPRPVMVWMHGGGFDTGAAVDYDARRLAVEGDVVVVTVNYRLGAMGFLSHPGLEDSGVFGLQDQQAALRWVRRNAAAFGGDAGNVTLFGESAGAMSACAQLVSPAAKGLFHKAILQSGSCLQSWPPSMIWPGAPAFRQFIPVAEAEASGLAAARALGCEGPAALDCLRALPAEAVMKGTSRSLPTFGGRLLPKEPAQALAEGRFHRVPLMWGATRDEWRSSAGIFAKTRAFTPELYAKFLADGYGPRAGEVEALYPAAARGGPAYAWAAVSTDTAFTCPTLKSAQLARRHVPVFHFQFADPDAPNPAYPVSADFKLGAAHATDLAYLFDLGGARAAFRPDQERLADAMVGYWASFAWSGRPAGKGLPSWPAMRDATDTRALALAPGDGAIRLVDIAANHNCAFWAGLKVAD